MLIAQLYSMQSAITDLENPARRVACMVYEMESVACETIIYVKKNVCLQIDPKEKSSLLLPFIVRR